MRIVGIRWIGAVLTVARPAGVVWDMPNLRVMRVVMPEPPDPVVPVNQVVRDMRVVSAVVLEPSVTVGSVIRL